MYAPIALAQVHRHARAKYRSTYSRTRTRLHFGSCVYMFQVNIGTSATHGLSSKAELFVHHTLSGATFCAAANNKWPTVFRCKLQSWGLVLGYPKP